MDYCVHAYGTKNSDHQIKNLSIPTDSQFAKFNARQIFPLYGIKNSIALCGRIKGNSTSVDYIAGIFHWCKIFVYLAKKPTE